MRKPARQTLAALAFILPNILGFIGFTLLPTLVSLVLAFSNWDIRLHNIYTHAWPLFNGLQNFSRLFHEFNFWKYFGNTLFLMIGIPFGIALSLAAALMLTQRLDGGSPRAKKRLILGALLAGLALVLASSLLALAGAPLAGMVVLLGGLACALLLAGTLMGNSIYRTLFYIPNFTAGVATFILWKKLYSPHNGPINLVLAPILKHVEGGVLALPASGLRSLAWFCALGLTVVAVWALRSLAAGFREAEFGKLSVGLGALLVLAPALAAPFSSTVPAAGWVAAVLSLLGFAWAVAFKLSGSRYFSQPSADAGLGRVLAMSVSAMTLELILLGMVSVMDQLPAWAAAGLNPPEWLSSYYWAKPAMIFMGLWAAMGSQNMLLYIAAISNIPPEINEAAHIDGATGMQRFWHVTWPQLAPVTLFIVIMSMIGGLQGGFEVTRTMTAGGPAGATTTLSYFIYTEGFESGHLGYASAISWIIFAMVLMVTLFNWKFGTRYADE